MNSRDYGIWLIPILAVLAIYLPRSAENKPQTVVSAQSSAETKGESARSEKSELSGGHPLLLFFDTSQRTTVFKELQSYKIDFLVATVPDPIDSSLGYLFDRHVSAIQLAGQAAGYVSDHFRLPWLGKEDKTVQQGKAIARYKLDRMGAPRIAEDAKLPRHQREPGILLLRAPGEKKLLLLYLIGETPTTGIQKPALINALREIAFICERLAKSKSESACKSVRLLAPTFSGAAESLITALEGWRKEATGNVWPGRFRIVSGSATAIGIETVQRLTRLAAEFRATVRPDSETLDALENYFCRYLRPTLMSVKPARIAVLRETTTGYGHRGDPSPKPRKESPCKEILTLTYPVHLSQLRRAAEKSKGQSKDSLQEAPSLRPRNLRLSLEEGTEPKDILTPFSAFTPFSVELILSDILSTISREGIHYLGLLSTDVRDQIFLAQEIRRHAPDVVLFTLSADLIYLHSDVNRDFYGMLLVSTYPLFTRNQLWTYPFLGKELRLQFPNDSTQGVYNATLALLDQNNLMLEYGRPFDFGRNAGGGRTPPIWLSAVGKNGIWPVRLLSVGRGEGNYLVAGSPADRGHIEAGWFVSPAVLFVLLCISVASTLASVGLLAHFPIPSLGGRLRRLASGIRKIWLLDNLSDSAFWENRPRRRLYLLAFCVVILVLGIVVNRVMVRALMCHPIVNSWKQLCSGELAPLTSLEQGLFHPMSWIIVLMLELPVLIAGISIFRAPAGLSMSERCYLLTKPVVLAPLTILVLVAVYAKKVTLLEPPDALVFYVRMLNPVNGLTPLIPLIFVGASALLWLFCNLRRLRLLEEFPARYFDEGSLTKIERAQSRIRDLLLCPSFSLPHSKLVLLFVGLPCSYLFLWKLTPALEEPVFYWLFGIAFIMVYVAVSLLVWRLWLTWWSTRDLLRRIVSHRIHRAYQTLIEKFPLTPRLNFSNPSTLFSALEFSTGQACRLLLSESQVVALAGDRDMNRDYRAKFEELKLCVMGAEHDARSSDQEEARDEWLQAIKLRSCAHAHLSQATTVVLDVLKPYWSAQAFDSTKSEDGWFASAEYFLAGRIAVFIHHLFLHLQNLLFSAMAGLLLLLLAVSSYPFKPGEELLLFNWAIILTAVVMTVVIFVQINRNSVISLLTKSAPGQVTWNREFVMKLLIYGVVPILALIGAQFPESLKAIFSWFGGSQGLN
jgi:hypothetical protein